MGTALVISLSAGILLAGPATAAEHRQAKLLWDGVDQFVRASVENSLSAQVRRPGRAAGVLMPAVFLHPQDAGRATAEYPLITQTLPGGTAVFFLGYAGIADGFDWRDQKSPPDGARFYVVADGRDVAELSLAASTWTPLAAKLGEVAAGPESHYQVTLALATDCGPAGNSNYDWAMFGQPLVVAVDSRHLPPDTPLIGAAGVAIAQVAANAGKLIVEGLDQAGAPVPGAAVSVEVAKGTPLTFLQFDFGKTPGCVQWRWRSEGLQVAQAWGGSWTPQVVMEHVGPAQAVTFVGEPLRVRATVRNRGMGAVLPEHRVRVQCGDVTQDLPRLAAGETAQVEFTVETASLQTDRIEAFVMQGDTASGVIVGGGPLVWPPPPELAKTRPDRAQALDLGEDYVVLQNPLCRWLICKTAPGLGALVYVWSKDAWELAGAVAPWLELATTQDGSHRPDFRDVAVRQLHAAVRMEASSSDRTLASRVQAELPDDSAAMRITVTLEARDETALFALWGPAVHAGDRVSGTDKGIAVFPGLEYLEDGERSSSERDLAAPLNQRWTPHRFKITVPMMMVETRTGGPVMAIMWDPNQKWYGENTCPGATFASPDFITHQDNHLMQLVLPAVPEQIPENGRRATRPLSLRTGDVWRLEQYIVAAVPEPDATAMLESFDSVMGYPPPEAWPRSFEDEIALCRHGFMVTCWDEATKKGRHVVDWGPANSPGHAALLLMDGRAVAQGDEKTRVLERVNLVGEQTLREQGAAGLASPANCHIMNWEFPYHWGHLPGALQGMRNAAYSALESQEDDGGWGYYPSEDRKSLGEPGTRVAGICGGQTYVMAKWAAISGDPVILEGLARALGRLRQFRVPRGAQGWECPIMEPDVLAAAYALRACVWAYMATGDPQCLEDAKFWARTGLAFQYAWDDGQRPGMRYASIPVFGSTFFTHSWLGLPVQWCGLVYAYGLQELMRFDPDNLWRRQVEGITVSAMYQQWPMDNAKLAGTYPDSYGGWFTVRNPVYINPENIQVNLMALKGLDPGLRSVTAKLGGELVHITAPAELKATARENALEVEATYLPRETVYLTLAPVAPTPQAKIAAGSTTLEPRDDLPPGTVGWAYDPGLCIMIIGVTCDDQGLARLSIAGVERRAPQPPTKVTGWEFDTDVQGWGAGHNCDVLWQDGAMRITVRGPDPYLHSGPAAINGNRSKTVRARVRLTAGNSLGLFWRAAASPQWGEDKHVSVAVTADGQWHEVEFQLRDHKLWAGKILQIRLDIEPADVVPGTTLDVDWIRVK